MSTNTVMVHLFAAEENGILGSQAWLKQNPSRIPKIAVLINRDQSPSAIVGAMTKGDAIARITINRVGQKALDFGK